jgi:hypothetical protein
MGIEQSAQNIADALAPSAQSPAVKWWWGTVVAVGEHGTMDVAVGGSTLYGIRASRHCMSAKVGDRVRVSYYGTEALVDAIRATERFSEGEVTAESAWTPYWSWLEKKDGVVSCTIQGQLANQIAAWSNFSVQIATLSDGYRPSDYYNFLAIAQVSSSPIPVLMQVAPTGGVYVRTFGTALPASTWLWMGFTYFAA